MPCFSYLLGQITLVSRCMEKGLIQNLDILYSSFRMFLARFLLESCENTDLKNIDSIPIDAALQSMFSLGEKWAEYLQKPRASVCRVFVSVAEDLCRAFSDACDRIVAISNVVEVFLSILSLFFPSFVYSRFRSISVLIKVYIFLYYFGVVPSLVFSLFCCCRK